MKKLIAIVSALLTFGGLSVVIASASRASVCESDGAGCTPTGTYPRLNASIGSRDGFNFVWTQSVVASYSSGGPVSWTAYVKMTNTTAVTLLRSCPMASSQSTEAAEHVSGGNGDTGTIYAATSYCDQHPGGIIAVTPGASFTDWATFDNVPWPGSEVSLTWGGWGTSAAVSPFISSEACVFDAPSGVATINGEEIFGHVGWALQLPDGSWEYGANEGPGTLDSSETWSSTGTWWQMVAAFAGRGQYYAAGFYTQYRCADVNTTSNGIAAAQKTEVDENNQAYAVPGQDCESAAYNILAAYAVSNLPSDLLARYWASPNNWFANLSSPGFFATEPL